MAPRRHEVFDAERTATEINRRSAWWLLAATLDAATVLRPLLVGRSVAPVQKVGPYAPVVESEALAMGGVRGC
jgi:hypothetical protein